MSILTEYSVKLSVIADETLPHLVVEDCCVLIVPTNLNEPHGSRIPFEEGTSGWLNVLTVAKKFLRQINSSQIGFSALKPTYARNANIISMKHIRVISCFVTFSSS